MEYDLKGKIDNFPVQRVDRSWGYYNLFAENMGCTVKILHIRKNELLDFQYHRFRDKLFCIMNDFELQICDRPVPDDINKDMDFLKGFIAIHMKTEKYTQGDIVYIPSFIIHRPIYKGLFEYGCIVDMVVGVNYENDIITIGG